MISDNHYSMSQDVIGDRQGNQPTSSKIGEHGRKQPLDGEWVNRKELRVIGMSRSGNHAIINWILRQARGRTCFLNCAEGKTNPFVSARELHNGLPYEVNDPDFDWEQEQAGIFSQKDLLIHSYEDSFLGYVCHPIFEQNHDQWVGKSLQRYDVLILRDPYNLFASRKQAGATLEGVPPSTTIRIWKQHAREFTGESGYLNQSRILINYNRWATERSYRQQLAAHLGLEFTDTGINAVPRTAGGSSFDGSRFDGDAGSMKVLERWKSYQNDPSYRQMLKPSWSTLPNGSLTGFMVWKVYLRNVEDICSYPSPKNALASTLQICYVPCKALNAPSPLAVLYAHMH